MVRLVTERLRLSPIDQADMADLIQLWADPVFTRFITGRALNQEEVWLRCLRDMGQWQAMGYGNWAIRAKDSGEFMGTVGVLDYRRAIEPPMNDPELGWGLMPRFNGQGFAFEAISTALDWVDRNLGAPRTLCMISPPNQASIRLANKLGYRPFTMTSYKDNDVVLYQRPRP